MKDLIGIQSLKIEASFGNPVKISLVKVLRDDRFEEPILSFDKFVVLSKKDYDRLVNP